MSDLTNPITILGGETDNAGTYPRGEYTIFVGGIENVEGARGEYARDGHPKESVQRNRAYLRSIGV
jgi:hypothetical protein